MTDELVSVIVPTKNSATHILNCLRSIRSQVYPMVETIVVDNDSTDRTKDIARVFADKVLNKSSERSVARNFGAKIASGMYLFFVDSDMELTAKIVDECVKAVHEESAHAVIIPEMSVREGFGLTVIEANACGTPAIAADVPGLNDIVKDNETGILVPPKNVDALAVAIIKLFRDEKLRSKLSRNALDWSKKIDWNITADHVLNIFLNTINSRD